MSRNGSGIYNLPTGNPVVTGTTITSNWGNTTMSDIATALTGSVAADGQTPITGNLQLGGNLITGMGAGVSSTDAVNLAQVTTAIAAVNSVVTGSIQMWPTASAPTGYLLCVGTAVSRTTYAALFAVLGTTFGSGDGSTTFNLPNYTNRMPYGTTLGATGGSADAIIVSHTHTATSVVTDPGHTHPPLNGSNFAGQGGSSQFNGPNFNTALSSTTGSSTTGITVATTNASTGASGTNANLPPYLGINFIIKV